MGHLYCRRPKRKKVKEKDQATRGRSGGCCQTTTVVVINVGCRYLQNGRYGGGHWLSLFVIQEKVPINLINHLLLCQPNAFTICCKDLLWGCVIIPEKGLVLFNPCFIGFINERIITPVAMETTKECPCANLITGVCLVSLLPENITPAFKVSTLRGGSIPLVQKSHVWSQSRGTLNRRSFGVVSCSCLIHHKAQDVSGCVRMSIMGGWGSGRSTFAKKPVGLLSCHPQCHPDLIWQEFEQGEGSGGVEEGELTNCRPVDV